MNQQAEREQIEDVLYAYLEAAPNPDYATLTEWIQRYPYYEQELTDFTVARNMLNALPEPEVPAQEEAALLTFGQSLVQSLFRQPSVTKPEPTQPLISSLLAMGKALGLTLQDIAKRTRLSVALVRKLDRRLITFSSTPRAIVEELARVLKQDVGVITGYLQLSPTLAQGANYRADQPPTLAEPENFATAIRNDRSLSDEDRAYWLSRAVDA